jgi:Uma2 family endonuclease
MVVEVTKRLFTAAEYYKMAEAGILSEDDRVELIEGEIVRMSPIGSRHAACVTRLDTLFHQEVGGDAIVWVQNPIRLDDYSEPEPDLTLVRPRNDFYAQGHPTPADVLLVIEVAETSQRYDRDVKIPLYARAGIPEVWLADLAEDAVYARTEPVNGVYQRVRRVQRGESLAPQLLPHVTLSVEAILG